MIRQPIVAGQFYPASAQGLASQVRGFLDKAPKPMAERTLLAMVPHAGYVYSGPVAGLTLGQANLAETILLLGPNHTGQGAPLALWDRGAWQTPGCSMPVHEDLAAALLAAEPRLQADTLAHVGEHSLEVLLPFLCAVRPGFSGAPLAVMEHRLPELSAASKSMARALASWPTPVSLVVSSDMSHYVSEDRARELDAMALEAALRLDPVGLYAIVRERGISMCGVLPMTLGLMIALELGAARADLAGYSTSAEASGDRERVVGYAGVLVR